MVGVNGGKFPAIRQHLNENIGGVYKDMDLTYVTPKYTGTLRLNRCIDSMNFRKKGRSMLKLVGILFRR